MASRKKHSEGIALLSMYNDDEEDEEMEDADDEEYEGEGEEFREPRSVEDASMADSDRVVVGDSGGEESSPRDDGESSVLTPSRAQAATDSGRVRSRREKLAIVDYGHDEVAMSPEPEEGEFNRNGRARGFTDRQSANDFHDKSPSGTFQVLTPSNQSAQLSDQSQFDKINYAVDDSEAGNAAEAIEEEEKDVEPLDSFLPPAPKEKCSEELQRKINKFLDYKKAGKSFNAEVRNRKDYRNPDFLLHAVSYQDIDQIGSCFSKDVFDPHGYDKSDYYNEIEDEMRREMDRKEQERKRSQKVDFLSAGTQTGLIPSAAKINLPVSGLPTGASAGLQSALPSADAVPRDGRQNKKSKWDKVDGDRRNPLPSGVQDLTLGAGAQSTVLSSVNAGAGYMAFMHQKRREAEEKRSSDWKLERRS